MLQRFFRLLHTLRYFKPIQWRYQLYYRVKNRFISVHNYKKYINFRIRKLSLSVDTILSSSVREYTGNKTFNFIGLQHSFTDQIDWNFQGNGKLWNYNLQYFSYLLDENIPPKERLDLLREFSEKILLSKVTLEPYPVSLRIINCLLFYSRYPITDSIILEAILKQIEYLENNLEHHILGNHLLENIFTLFISSIYIDNQSLYKKAKHLLVVQLNEQILDDGGHYECSVMYHSILLSKLLLCIDVVKNTNSYDSEDIEVLKKFASKMLGWINNYSFPDGSWALMNDAAEGIAPTTQSLFSAALVLDISAHRVSLSSSGFSKIKGDNWEIIVKSGGVQPSYQPGHTHADIGNICLWYKGIQLIVDRGISTYNANENRIEERGTLSHNTTTIAGLNQSDVWSSFRIGKRAKVKKNISDTFIEISISPYHDRNSIHKRIITKVSESKLTISDTVSTSNNSTTLVATGALLFSKNSTFSSFGNILENHYIRVTPSDSAQLKYEKGIYSTQFNKNEYGMRLSYEIKNTVDITVEFL